MKLVQINVLDAITSSANFILKGCQHVAGFILKGCQHVAGFILKGCQHVAGGRAQRTPPVNSNKLSRPEGDARQTHCWHPFRMRFNGLRAGDGVLLITGYKLYSVREKT